MFICIGQKIKSGLEVVGKCGSSQRLTLLQALEAGSGLVCNTQHIMAEALKLPFPKDPSTILFVRWAFVRVLVLLLKLVPCSL